MNAIDLLEDDHQQMRVLMTRAVTAGAEERREHLIGELRMRLIAHERMEEEIFYPPLRDHQRTHDIVLEGYEEHHVADTILDELLETPAGSDVWKAKMKVLKENVEHHLEEEEGEMFKKARKILSTAQLDEMGRQMARMQSEMLTR